MVSLSSYIRYPKNHILAQLPLNRQIVLLGVLRLQMWLEFSKQQEWAKV